MTEYPVGVHPRVLRRDGQQFPQCQGQLGGAFLQVVQCLRQMALRQVSTLGRLHDKRDLNLAPLDGSII